jgi:hypothetical protein
MRLLRHELITAILYGSMEKNILWGGIVSGVLLANKIDGRYS